MQITNDTSFALGAIAVKAGSGAPKLTVVVKGSFTLAPGETARIAPEQQPLCGDQYWGEGAEQICRYEDDFAPFKPRADLLVVGYGESGDPAPGTCRVGGQGAALASFGPVSRNTGARAELASVRGDDWFSYHWPRLGAACPWDYFNAAPPEMQIDGYLEGGEEIALDNLHPRHKSFRARLPGLRARCFLKPEGGAAAEVPMNLDTLWLDAASDTLVLVWRGQTEADPDLETDLLVVSENLGDPPGAAADYCARLESAEVAEEKPESEKAEKMLAAAGGAPDGLPPEIKLALDDPEAGTPVLVEQAHLDDPRFDGLATGEGPGDPNTGMDGVAAASGDPEAAAPAPLKDFFAAKDDSEDDSEDDAGQDPGVADATSTKLADLGLSQSVQDTVVAPEGPSNAKAGSTGTLLLAGLEFGDLPPDVQAALEDETATAAAMKELDNIEPGEPPPSEMPGPGLEEAIETGKVPDWPPRSTDDLTAIADLTAAFGADRPPRGQGTSFLSLLAAIAGDSAAEESTASQERET